MSVNLCTGLSAPLNSALLHKVASTGDYRDLKNKPADLASFLNNISGAPGNFAVGRDLFISTGSVTCQLNPLTLVANGSSTAYTSTFGPYQFLTPQIQTGTLLAGTVTAGSLSATLSSISSLTTGSHVSTYGSVANLYSASGSVTTLFANFTRAVAGTVLTGSIGTLLTGTCYAGYASVSSLQGAYGSLSNLACAGATLTGSSISSLLCSAGTFNSLTLSAGSIAACTIASLSCTSGSVTQLYTSSLTCASGSVSQLQIGSLTCTTASLTALNAQQSILSTLTVGAASVSNLSAAQGSITTFYTAYASISSGSIGNLLIGTNAFTQGSVANLNAGTATLQTGSVNLLLCATGSVDSLQADVLLAPVVTASTLTADTATVLNVTASTLTATTQNVATSAVGTLTAARANIVALVGTSASLSGLTAASGSITALTAGDFVTGTLTCKALKTPLSPGTGCLFQSGAYNDSAGLNNTATWPTSAAGVGTYTGSSSSNGQYAFSGYIYSPYAVTVPFLLQAPQSVPTGSGLTLQSFDWYAAPNYSAAAGPKAGTVRTTSTSQPALYNLGPTAAYAAQTYYADGSGATLQTPSDYQVFWNGYLFSPIQRTVYFGLQTYSGSGQNNSQPYVGCSIAGVNFPGYSPVFASGWGSYSAGNVANSNYFYNTGAYWWKVTLQPGWNTVTDIGFRARTGTGFATQNFGLCWWADSTNTPAAAGASGATWQAVPANVLFTGNTTTYNNEDVWTGSSIAGVTLASAVQAVTGTAPATWIGNPQYFPISVPLAAGANAFRVAFRLAGASGGAASFQLQYNLSGGGYATVPTATLYPNVPAAIGNFFDGQNFSLGSGTISCGPVKANGSVTATALGLPNASAFTGNVSQLNNDSSFTSVTKVSQLTNDLGFTNVTNNNQLTNGNGYYSNGDTITCYQLNLNSQAQGSITQGPSQVTVWSANDGHWYSSGKHFLFGADGSGYCPGGWKTSSDRRVKQDIEYLDPSDSYDLVKQLKPCSFVYKETGSPSVGYIAQELQTVIPTAVAGYYKENHEDDEVTILSADYAQPGVVLASAMQQLQTLVEQLTARMDRLEASASSSTTP